MDDNISFAIYLKSSGGFGNHIFDLISAIYLKNRYHTDVYIAIGQLQRSNQNNPFFGDIFYRSEENIKFIDVKTYYGLKQTSPITEMWINDLSELPEKIKQNISFGGLYRFAYIMFSSFNESDKKIFTINSELILPEIQKKYINKMKSNYGCIHIRYGDKLCFGMNELKETKYTQYTVPLYAPQYYIDQINELLKKDLDEIVITTDSPELVKKYIMKFFDNNSKVVLFDQNYINAFYLMTNAAYLILSYSTFSFSAAYINENAICYLLKKYVIDPKKDYIFEDDAISPNWIILDNKEYLLNFNQELLKIMAVDYGKCRARSKKLKQKAGQTKDGRKIVSENLDGLTTTGPLIIEKTRITTKLLVHGTVTFSDLTVLGTVKIYGTMNGKDGTFNTLSIYGSSNLANCTIKKVLCTGPFYADKMVIPDSASVIGPFYLSNSKVKIMELVSDDITINKCNINTLTIHNSDNEGIKIAINDSTIDTIIVKGVKLMIDTNVGTKINKFFNAEIAVMNQ